MPSPREATRREVLRAALALPLSSVAGSAHGRQAPVDRKALVRRHNVVLNAVDIESPLQVGNGEFAMTVDITGLQTLADAYEDGMPLGTMAQWGWHSFPPVAGLDLDDVYTLYHSHGRRVPYADGRRPFDTEAHPETRDAAVWRRANPHRMHLGRLALVRNRSDRVRLTATDVEAPRQELDLWTGAIESRFRLDGEQVVVTTVCHPRLDAVAVRVRSPLVRAARLGLELAFPYPAGEWRRTANWSAADRHETRLRSRGTRAVFERALDETTFRVHAIWPAGGALRPGSRPHQFELTAPGRDVLDLTVAFSPAGDEWPPDVDRTHRAAAGHWERFWTTGGAVDLSLSTDERAEELERRVVRSQYLTAVNCAGSMPPQETGLVTNSWYGKHHLEMHWWHAAHFVPWGRRELLERSLPWYRRILPRARELATRQGYRGARWPKQVGPEGRESPSGVAVFLIWQQPHPIFFAELLYRAAPRRDTLQQYADLVFETAEFMASYAAWDARTARFVLGPPLIPAQESYGSMRDRVINPTFELAYWHWGLSTAQNWRERMGLAREPEWDKVLSGLSRPRVRNGIYAAIDVEPFTIRADHPSMLAALGMLPLTPMVDPAIMRRTLDDVSRGWDWASTWGWDYPMMAMTAARVGEPARAIDALLMDAPKNRYLPNGHNLQTPGRLPLYLPGNGGLLYAVAMMAGGWTGAPERPAPGFPAAAWRVRAEGLTAVI